MNDGISSHMLIHCLVIIPVSLSHRLMIYLAAIINWKLAKTDYVLSSILAVKFGTFIAFCVTSPPSEL